MKGYILLNPCDQIDLSKNRAVYQDVETKKHYIHCSDCMANFGGEGSCLREVDISYAFSPTCQSCGHSTPSHLGCTKNEFKVICKDKSHWVPRLEKGRVSYGQNTRSR